ncbi:hypothetical protein Tco_0996318, partial [Tanacetum coccineum]
CFEVGGGGGGVTGGVGVVCGDGVDSGVGSIVCGFVVCGGVKAPVSMMIVSVPEKDRWDVIVDRGGWEDIKMTNETNVTAPVNVTEDVLAITTTLSLARFLNEAAPQVEPPTEVLNGLVDSLYNVYYKTTIAKELWESLERKYKTEDAGTKKFVVARFLDYKMDDSKTMIIHVQDLQVLLHDSLKSHT